MRAKEGDVCVCVCVWKGGRKIGRERSATFRSAWIFDGVKVAGNPRHDRLNYWLISMARIRIEEKR